MDDLSIKSSYRSTSACMYRDRMRMRMQLRGAEGTESVSNSLKQKSSTG